MVMCAPSLALDRLRDAADVRQASAYYEEAASSGRRARLAQPRGPDEASIADATATLAAARAAEDAGQWDTALQLYTGVCDRHADLALVHRARVARALLLFQVSQRDQAFLELEDELVDIGAGNADVHAALAVVLHATRPSQVGRAEAEWDLATRFAPRYADVDWVRTTKRWPPAMLAALDGFLKLS